MNGVRVRVRDSNRRPLPSPSPAHSRRHFASVRTVNGRGPGLGEGMRERTLPLQWGTPRARSAEAKAFFLSRARRPDSQCGRRCHSHAADTYLSEKRYRRRGEGGNWKNVATTLDRDARREIEGYIFTDWRDGFARPMTAVENLPETYLRVELRILR